MHLLSSFHMADGCSQFFFPFILLISHLKYLEVRRPVRSLQHVWKSFNPLWTILLPSLRAPLLARLLLCAPFPEAWCFSSPEKVFFQHQELFQHPKGIFSAAGVFSASKIGFFPAFKRYFFTTSRFLKHLDVV